MISFSFSLIFLWYIFRALHFRVLFLARFRTYQTQIANTTSASSHMCDMCEHEFAYMKFEIETDPCHLPVCTLYCVWFQVRLHCIKHADANDACRKSFHPSYSNVLMENSIFIFFLLYRTMGWRIVARHHHLIHFLHNFNINFWYCVCIKINTEHSLIHNVHTTHVYFSLPCRYIQNTTLFNSPLPYIVIVNGKSFYYDIFIIIYEIRVQLWTKKKKKMYTHELCGTRYLRINSISERCHFYTSFK